MSISSNDTNRSSSSENAVSGSSEQASDNSAVVSSPLATNVARKLVKYPTPPAFGAMLQRLPSVGARRAVFQTMSDQKGNHFETGVARHSLQRKSQPTTND